MDISKIETIFLPGNIRLSGYQGEYILEKIRNENHFYEQELLNRWILPCAEHLRVIYDIGANIGNHTVYFAVNAKQAQIFSFEPMKVNYAVLRKNVEDNSLSNVETFPFALGTDVMQARMNFEKEGNNGTSSIQPNSKDGEIVQIKALDALDLPLPDFVKIDVEGFELQVLRGMKQTLLAAHPIVWIEVDGDTAKDVYNFMKELGYTPVDYVLTSSNNVMFKKQEASDADFAIVFADLMKEAEKARSHWVQLGNKISQYHYEQKKAQDLYSQLQSRTSQFEYEQNKVKTVKHQLKTQLEDEQKKAKALQQKLQLLVAQLEDKQETVEKKDQQIEKINIEMGTLRKQYGELQSRMNMYQKSKLFRLMLFSWNISSTLRYHLKRKLFALGHWGYVQLMPYPKVRTFFSKLNGKLHIFKDPQAVVSFQNKKPLKGLAGAVSRAKAQKLPGQMNVAMIVDEFTYNSFRFECNAFPLEPQNWREIFEKNDIDMFFCESAWAGVDSVRRPWRGQIYSSINFPRENRTTLLEILQYCNQHKIPTAFWNKEDPTHYEDKVHNFVDTAIKFDHIFTTSSQCVQRYKDEYGHTNVHLLMFATQPRLFNPIEKFNRTDDIIFAGSWYNQHPARCAEMGKILDGILASDFSLKIYNRHSETNDSNHFFPDRFTPYLNPSLPHHQMDIAYKGSHYALNINTVTDSDTMFARRVFELMSSNTLVLSNYSKGMEELFGDNVVFVNEAESLEIRDQHTKRRNCLYEVLRYHTYSERFRQILRDIGMEFMVNRQGVTILYRVANETEAETAAAHFFSLDWIDKKAVFLVNKACAAEELRGVLIKYQGTAINVISEHYCQQYQNVLSIDSEYFMWADISLKPDFIRKAMLHFCYLDRQTGVADGGETYIIEPRSDMTNVLLSADCFNDEREREVYLI